jgi:type 1 fimbria pilin
MIKNSTKQKIAIATAMTLAFITAQAQSADGTVVISGQVNANTCTLNISDAGGVASPTNKGTRSIELGTYSPVAGTAGSFVGNKQTITFTLTNAAGTGACSFSGTSTTKWNLALDLQPNQVNSTTFQTAPAKPYLVNTVTTNASNIAVALFGSDSPANHLTAIATGAGYLGTKLSTAGANVGDSLTMGAQFIATTASAPTPGLFSATVPLLIVYQ